MIVATIKLHCLAGLRAHSRKGLMSEKQIIRGEFSRVSTASPSPNLSDLLFSAPFYTVHCDTCFVSGPLPEDFKEIAA